MDTKTNNLKFPASSISVLEVLEKFLVDPEEGLKSSVIEQRRRQYGLNRIEETKRRSNWQILLDQFKSPIIALLAVAAILSFIFEHLVEGIAIMIAIVLNTTIGFFTEVKAIRSMEALKKLSRTHAKVKRQGKLQEISSEELVPGDIVLFEGGDLVPADLRIIEASKLQVDESSLTGESVPVNKTVEPLPKDLPLAEQTNMLFKGTAITRGSGEGVVVATGMNTELGHISALTAGAKEEITPLEKRLDQLGRWLIAIALGIAILIGIAGIIGGKDLYLMVETAIALAVGAVPEGLPIVATVALARGMWRMAKQNALINRLSAVETLGATSIICTDKTGTLTENRMTVAQIALESGTVEIDGKGLDLKGEFIFEGKSIEPLENKVLRSALEVGVLCNNANLPETESDQFIGDPMEIALLIAGAKAGIKRQELLEDLAEVKEVAFESETKMMATIHAISKGYFVAVKGAPEAVLSVCSHRLTSEGVQEMGEKDRQVWEERCHAMAQAGFRILAMASKTVDDIESEPYEQLTFFGVFGILDPPRQDVKEAIEECHQAGIRVIIVTGDLPVTAYQVGLAVGSISDKETEVRLGEDLKSFEKLSKQERLQLEQVNIFARVSPEQKLNLISLHQHNNAIVAMTGDGVNDAPALKKADIGVAMGKRGTQVAKEAADMVLQDDAFSSIVAAIEQGRTIFTNIRKFTLYLLSGNMGEIIAVGVASIVNAPLPLLPLQILFLNAVNDVFPALALGVGKGNPQQMKHPPRKKNEPILDRRHWLAIGGYGIIIALCVLGVFALSIQVLRIETERAVTISFLTLAFARLWHVFNMRDKDTNVFRNEVTENPYIWGSLLLCTGMLLLAVYVPGLAQVLKVVNPGWQGWGLILGVSLIPLVLGQLWKIFHPTKWR